MCEWDNASKLLNGSELIDVVFLQFLQAFQSCCSFHPPGNVCERWNPRRRVLPMGVVFPALPGLTDNESCSFFISKIYLGTCRIRRPSYSTFRDGYGSSTKVAFLSALSTVPQKLRRRTSAEIRAATVVT